KKHLRHFAEHFQPVGALETLLVRAMADTQWRLDRLPRLESGILALGRRRCDSDLFADVYVSLLSRGRTLFLTRYGGARQNRFP
ncbi:MAG: hypothetical protein JO185_13045, partial [Acidobacteriaceae bacterium]|nr:hypothetical protein [Acidobacteriaceae bacterium]